MRNPARARWPLVLIGGLLAAAIVAWVLAWVFLSPIFEGRLRAAIEPRIDGELRIGSLSYLPPYWLRASDVALTRGTGDASVEWIRIDAVRVDLGSVPWGGGPLDVDEVVVSEPTLRVERDEEGLRTPLDFVQIAPAEQGGRVPSVERLVVEDGTVAYLRGAGGSSRAEPLDLSGIELRLDQNAGEGKGYAFEIEGGSPSVIAIAAHGVFADGRIDVGQMALDFRLPLGSGDGASGKPLDVSLQEASGTIATGERTWRLEQGALYMTRGGSAQEGSKSPPGTPLPALSSIDLDFDVTGKGSFGGEDGTEYRLEGTANGGSVAIAPAELTLDDVRGTAVLTRGSFDVSGLDAKTLGGKVSGRFSVPRGGGTWDASLETDGLELDQLAERFGGASPGSRMAGQVSGRGSFSGSTRGAFLDSLEGQGDVQARGHDFYEIPIAAELLEAAHLGGAATLRNAAARFRVGERRVELENAALSSPTVGMQGQGQVRFDGSVDLEFVVVPLGDWKSKLEASGIPLVGGAIAQLAGKIQEVFGSASELVYEFRVTGTLANPEVVPVAAPVLTRTAATVFGAMVADGWDTQLLDALGGEAS